MWYRYNIADIRGLCHIPYSLTIQQESREFMCPLPEGESAADAVFTADFVPVETLSSEWQQGHREVNQYFLRRDGATYTYHCPMPGTGPYACTIWPDKGSAVQCLFKRDSEEQINLSRNINDMIHLETLLLRFGGLLLHASFIRYKGQGIVFSAPSGTGKSTQANLWEQYRQSETINGDRAAFRKINGVWRAYGLPYAGSSGIYRNENAPLVGIVVLRQAPFNRLQRIHAAEAMRYLLPEFTLHRWDTLFMNEAVTRILTLLQEVPVYLLECLPDEQAVALLHHSLFEESC